MSEVEPMHPLRPDLRDLPDQIEVLRSTGPQLNKTWQADGAIRPYLDARNFRRESVKVSSIGDMHTLLQRLEKDLQACVIRGRYIGDAQAAYLTAQLPEAERRSDGTLVSGRPEPGCVFRRRSYFHDQPLHLVMFDIEGTHTVTDPMKDPEGACVEWIAGHMPPEFHDVSFCWQLSGSFGHPSKPGLRVHLWFWLNEARTSLAVKAWAKEIQLSVDISVFNPVQVHYTAGPSFESGVANPVPRRSGLSESLTTDAVDVDIPELPAANPSASVTNSVQLTEITDAELVKVKSALNALAPCAGDNATWSEAGYALLSLGGLGRKLFEDFSNDAPNGREGAAEDWWSSHSTQTPRSDFRHLFAMAHKLAKWKAPPKLGNLAAFQVVDTSENSAPTVGRTVIRIVNGAMHEAARQAESALVESRYVHGPHMVRFGNSGKLVRDTPDSIQRALTELRCFQRFDVRANDWRDIDCPYKLAVNILEQKDYHYLRPLRGLSTAPFVREDGSICETRGYDSASQVFYAPNALFPLLPKEVTKTQAVEALHLLLAVFDEFPFKDDAAKSAFAAHILAEVARMAIDTSPMTFYTAPEAGSGKTRLMEAPTIIAHGVRLAIRQWSSSDEEMRKVLTASVMTGDRSIAFDNIPTGHTVRSPILCAFLTTPVLQDRKLGQSENITAPNTAVVAASGNNVVPKGDMARRSLVGRLDSGMTSEQLRNRVFKIDNVPQYLLDHRVELLIAALTVIRGHRQSGHKGPAPLPSFEKWSRIVRDALLWLDMADPVDTQAEETDDETTNLSAAFELLGPMFSGREFTAQDLLIACGGLIDVNRTLATTLQDAGCSDPQDSRKLGYWLTAAGDKIAGGYKLERVNKRNSAHKGTNRYRLRQLAAVDDFGDLI